MATLGLSMIVKNESDVLHRALDGVKNVVDEIVIVDTGSTDDTVEIARRYTPNVYAFDWINDFSAARNFALSKITADYWLWLDADDVVPFSTAQAIKKLMRRRSPEFDIVMLPYVAATDESNNPTFVYYRERIIRNSSSFMWQGAVHEAVALNGNVVKLNKPIFHSKPQGRSSGTRNLDIYETLIKSGHKLDGREKYYYARELFYNNRIRDAANELAAFIYANDGFSVNKADACLLLSECYRKLGDMGSALQAALYRFAFTVPDGEGCCQIGSLFIDENDYNSAAYWYKQALKSKPDFKSGAFVQTDYYGFIPLVWLAVCYDKLGDEKKAFYYHCRAKKLHPNNNSVVANDAYFAALGFSDGISGAPIQ